MLAGTKLEVYRYATLKSYTTEINKQKTIAESQPIKKHCKEKTNTV